MQVVPYESLVTGPQSSSHGGDDDDWKPYLQLCFTPAHIPELYAKHKAVGGQMRVCIFCIETQHDHVSHKNKDQGVHTATMIRIQRTAQAHVEGIDVGHGDVRYMIQRQLKYAMHNNGDHGNHDKRKQVCIGTIRNLFLFCNADELLDFLNETLANGHKIDDLCDAFSLMLMTAIEQFAESLQNRHPGQGNPLIKGTSHLNLEGETCVALGTDPGKVNFARCIGEVVALDPRAKEIYVTNEDVEKEHTVPRPYFRVHRWQLIDLVNGKIKADFKGPTKIYHRLDVPTRNVTAQATPGRISGGLAPPPKPIKKRKRGESDTKQSAPAKHQRLDAMLSKKKATTTIDIDLSE